MGFFRFGFFMVGWVVGFTAGFVEGFMIFLGGFLIMCFKLSKFILSEEVMVREVAKLISFVRLRFGERLEEDR